MKSYKKIIIIFFIGLIVTVVGIIGTVLTNNNKVDSHVRYMEIVKLEDKISKYKNSGITLNELKEELSIEYGNDNVKKQGSTLKIKTDKITANIDKNLNVTEDKVKYALFSLLQYIGIIIITIVIYFLPTFIAINRQHINKVGVILLDILLGWTLIGWVGSLIWAIYKEDSYVNTDKKYEDLARLQKLKESGAITDIEFEIEKAKLLK